MQQPTQREEGDEPPSTPPALRGGEAFALFGIALLLRLALVWALDSPRMAESGDPWTWGQESVCVAESLVADDAYGDPWNQGTGASAWLTPVYPAYVAACIRLAGGISREAAWLVHVGQALVSALTCLLLALLGRRLGAPGVGRIAAWILVFLPASLWNASHTVWDTTFAAAALLGYLVLAMGPVGEQGRSKPFREGLLFGFLGLVSPSLWGILPVALWHLVCRPGGADRLRRLVLFGSGTLLLAGPWMLRNGLVVGSYGLRSNLGVELRVGNNDRAFGRHETAFHPSHTPEELARYRELGEHAYANLAGKEAIAWMRENPAAFLGLSLTRVRLFWLGETPLHDPRVDERVGTGALLRGWVKWGAHAIVGILGLLGALFWSRAGALLAWSAVLFPLPYYITHVAERYRYPIEPLLLLLAVGWVASVRSRRPLSDRAQ